MTVDVIGPGIGTSAPTDFSSGPGRTICCFQWLSDLVSLTKLVSGSVSLVYSFSVTVSLICNFSMSDRVLCSMRDMDIMLFVLRDVSCVSCLPCLSGDGDGDGVDDLEEDLWCERPSLGSVTESKKHSSFRPVTILLSIRCICLDR